MSFPIAERLKKLAREHAKASKGLMVHFRGKKLHWSTSSSINETDIKDIIANFYTSIGPAAGRWLHINTGVHGTRFGHITSKKDATLKEDDIKPVLKEFKLKVTYQTVKPDEKTGLPTYPNADVIDAWDYSF